MGVLSDFWSGLPKELQIIFAISIFLYIGSTLMQIIIWAWNFFVIGAMNLANGCTAGTNLAACVPYQAGIYVLGINFADYWTITILVILLPIALFAIKWYGFMFGAIRQ